MAKRIYSLIAVVAACVFLMCATAFTAVAAPSEAPEVDKSLTVSSPIAMETAATPSVHTYVYSDKEKHYQGLGVKWVYDLSSLGGYNRADDLKVKVTSSGNGQVKITKVKGSSDRYYITAKKAGKVKITYTMTWTEQDEVWVEDEPVADTGDDNEGEDDDSYWNDYYYPSGHSEYVATPHTEKHYFYIYVLSLKNTSGTLTKVVTTSSPYATPNKKLTFKLSGLPSNPDVNYVKDSSKKGYSYITKASKGKVTFYVSGAGTHNIKVKAYGKTITCKAVLRVLTMKDTNETKYTGSLTTYPGKTSALAISVTGVKSPTATWSSTNTNVATVNSKGVVTAKGVGRCYVKAKVGGATVKMLVEVTTSGAYWAIQNGYSDMNYPLTYSQENRMGAAYRDCSSFVSRCYWDPSLGRYIYSIGGYAGTWALTAAGQGEWLCNQGRTVAWNACDISKLRPGDTIYFETQYRGQNDRWCHIDHAALYVGNGYYLHTGGYGGKGTVGLSRYWSGDSSVRFIGRPCPW